MAKEPMGDVVVLLPGILGSVLDPRRQGRVGAVAGRDRAGAVDARAQRARRSSCTTTRGSVDDLGDGVDGAAADGRRAPDPRASGASTSTAASRG